MSRENVEVVRRWFETLNTRPGDVLAFVSEFWDADADFFPVRKFPEARPCHGLEEISQFVARLSDAWSRFDWTIRDLIDVGGERVLVHAVARAEGHGSEMRLEGDVYHCMWLRHGRFFRAEDHVTLRGALHALGLEGETLEAVGLRE
jgi:SnoaL-like domain